MNLAQAGSMFKKLWWWWNRAKEDHSRAVVFVNEAAIKLQNPVVSVTDVVEYLVAASRETAAANRRENQNTNRIIITIATLAVVVALFK